MFKKGASPTPKEEVFSFKSSVLLNCYKLNTHEICKRKAETKEEMSQRNPLVSFFGYRLKILTLTILLLNFGACMYPNACLYKPYLSGPQRPSKKSNSPQELPSVN